MLRQLLQRTTWRRESTSGEWRAYCHWRRGGLAEADSIVQCGSGKEGEERYVPSTRRQTSSNHNSNTATSSSSRGEGRGEERAKGGAVEREERERSEAREETGKIEAIERRDERRGESGVRSLGYLGGGRSFARHCSSRWVAACVY